MTDPMLTRAAPAAPARILQIDDPSEEDLSSSMTVQERVAMVTVISRRMWEISGLAWPSYPRSEIPVTIIQPE